MWKSDEEAVTLQQSTIELESCPKCSREVDTSAAACRSCGLLRGKFESFRLEGTGAAGGHIRSLWRSVELNWTDLEAHERFLAAVGNEKMFAPAAALYRAAARERPGDKVAARQLERIHRTVLAIHQVTTDRQRDEKAPSPYRSLTALLVILFLGGAASLVAVHGRMNREKPESSEIRALTPPPVAYPGDAAVGVSHEPDSPDRPEQENELDR